MGQLGLQVTCQDPLPLAVLELDGREPESATHAVRNVRQTSQLADIAVALATRLEQGEVFPLVGLHSIVGELLHPFAVQASGGDVLA